MNFHDLRIIVGQIKKGIKCAKCETKYKDEDIEVIGSLGDEQTLFHACCGECESESIINVSIQLETPESVLPKIHKKLGTAPRMGRVTVNDVLDVQNFLKDFKGNFSELFNTENSK